MTNDPMEDREVDLWREQWSGIARPSPEFRRQVQKRIKVQERRFWLGNLLALAAFVGMLTLAFYQLSHRASRLENGQATGVCVLLFVAVTCRLWIMRRTWRAETQSVRAFMELWRRRVLARIRGLQIAINLAIGWLVFCAALAAANGAIIRFELMAHLTEYLAMMVVMLVMLPVIWFGAMRLRRRKVAELNEVTRLLEVIETMNG
jgi:magnesium-transporting ATPase (P-type)